MTKKRSEPGEETRYFRRLVSMWQFFFATSFIIMASVFANTDDHVNGIPEPKRIYPSGSNAAYCVSNNDGLAESVEQHPRVSKKVKQQRIISKVLNQINTRWSWQYDNTSQDTDLKYTLSHILKPITFANDFGLGGSSTTMLNSTHQGPTELKNHSCVSVRSPNVIFDQVNYSYFVSTVSLDTAFNDVGGPTSSLGCAFRVGLDEFSIDIGVYKPFGHQINPFHRPNFSIRICSNPTQPSSPAPGVTEQTQSVESSVDNGVHGPTHDVSIFPYIRGGWTEEDGQAGYGGNLPNAPNNEIHGIPYQPVPNPPGHGPVQPHGQTVTRYWSDVLSVSAPQKTQPATDKVTANITQNLEPNAKNGIKPSSTKVNSISNSNLVLYAGLVFWAMAFILPHSTNAERNRQQTLTTLGSGCLLVGGVGSALENTTNVIAKSETLNQVNNVLTNTANTSKEVMEISNNVKTIIAAYSDKVVQDPTQQEKLLAELVLQGLKMVDETHPGASLIQDLGSLIKKLNQTGDNVSRLTSGLTVTVVGGTFIISLAKGDALVSLMKKAFENGLRLCLFTTNICKLQYVYDHYVCLWQTFTTLVNIATPAQLMRCMVALLSELVLLPWFLTVLTPLPLPLHVIMPLHFVTKLLQINPKIKPLPVQTGRDDPTTGVIRNHSPFVPFRPKPRVPTGHYFIKPFKPRFISF